MSGPQTRLTKIQIAPDRSKRGSCWRPNCGVTPAPLRFGSTIWPCSTILRFMTWMQDTYGLKRPEYVVLVFLGTCRRGQRARYLAHVRLPKEYAEPRNQTAGADGPDRSTHKAPEVGGGRPCICQKRAGRLSTKRRPVFEAQENRMLKALSDGERQILSELMSKVVTCSAGLVREIRRATLDEMHRRGMSNESCRNELARR